MDDLIFIITYQRLLASKAVAINQQKSYFLCIHSRRETSVISDSICPWAISGKETASTKVLNIKTSFQLSYCSISRKQRKKTFDWFCSFLYLSVWWRRAPSLTPLVSSFHSRALLQTIVNSVIIWRGRKSKSYQLSPEKAAFRMWPKLRIFVLFDIEETPLPFRFIGESPEALFAIWKHCWSK